MIAYASRQLKLHKTRYPTYDLELGAMVFALKIWMHSIYRLPCTICMDHKCLRQIIDQPNLNMRHHKWLDVVKDYDCKILDHSGKAKMVVDTLIREAAGPFDAVACMRISMDSLIVGLIRRLGPRVFEKRIGRLRGSGVRLPDLSRIVVGC